MIDWNKVSKDGLPAKSGVYLVKCQRVKLPRVATWNVKRGEWRHGWAGWDGLSEPTHYAPVNMPGTRRPS